jgi:hypothetical protein
VSEHRDPLEAELAALTPRAVSPNLRTGIASRLRGSRTRPWGWLVALAGLLLVAAVVVISTPGRKEPLPPTSPLVPPPPAVTEPESPPPSVLTYQRALARSPAEFDALLDQQSATNPGPVATAGLARSAATLAAFLGEN